MAAYKKQLANFYDDLNNLDEVSKIQAEEIKKGAERALQKFKNTWPVDTGYSLKEWRVGSDDLNGDKTSISIVNDAYYTKWVHKKGETTPQVYKLDDYIKAEQESIKQETYKRLKTYFEKK